MRSRPRVVTSFVVELTLDDTLLMTMDGSCGMKESLSAAVKFSLLSRLITVPLTLRIAANPWKLVVVGPAHVML